jgi:hypothetical protein
LEQKANSVQALMWFERAAQLGDADGQYNLAKLYLQDPNRSPLQAIKYLYSASQQGHSEAQDLLGSQRPSLICQDPEALTWYIKRKELPLEDWLRNLRLDLLSDNLEYLSTLSDLISVGLTYRLDRKNIPILTLYTNEPLQLQRQIVSHLSKLTFDIQVSRPGDIDSLPSDSEPPLLQHDDYIRLLSALEEANQILFIKHSNLTMITIGYGYSFSDSIPAWDSEPCILVYVYQKGYIPWGEDPIAPEILGHKIRVMQG